VQAGADGSSSVQDLQEVDDSGQKSGGPGFDRPSDDPAFRFQADAQATYRILLRDHYAGSNPSPCHVYRLSIRKPEPDFHLVAALKATVEGTPPQTLCWNPLLRKGGTIALRVIANRRHGFAGEIQLSASGLPAGITCQPAVIPPDVQEATLVLEASEQVEPWSGAVTILGTARRDDQEIVRRVQGVSIVWDATTRPVSRATRTIALAVNSETEPVHVTVGERKAWEMSRAGKLTIPVHVTRRGTVKGELVLRPVDVPKEIRVAELKLPENQSDGNIELTIDRAARPGMYSFHLAGNCAVSYQRNAEAAARAEAEKQLIGKRSEELAMASSQASEAQKSAEARAKQMAEEAGKAAEAAMQMTKTAAEMQSQLTGLNEALVRAKETAGQLPEEKELAASLEQVASVAQSVMERKTRELEQRRSQAQAAADEVAKRAAEAEEARKQAEQVAMQTAEQARAADEAKKQAEQDAAKLAEAAKPADRSMSIASSPVSLHVTDAPVRLSFTTSSVELSPGEKKEVVLSIQRHYGFADPFRLTTTVPQGVAGLRVADIDVPKDQAEAKLTVDAAGDATLGQHPLIIKGKLNFNGQELEFTHTLVVSVKAAS
jgi:hypothetical protein